MNSQDLGLTLPLSATQLRYQRAVLGVAKALEVMKSQVTGPAVAGETEKHELVMKHLVLLNNLEGCIEELTVSGADLTAEEHAVFHRPAQSAIHPLLMLAPFARRSFEKPLGYAGDYVMVRHILDDPFQGDSAFVQLLSLSLLQTDVAQGHRNRINVLVELLASHAARGQALGKPVSALTIGCGPAEETYRFIRTSEHADCLDLTLLDFSEETLQWTEGRLASACNEAGKRPQLHYVQDSVYNLAKQKPEGVKPAYDVVICAGLFDYLTDRFCRRVIEYGMRSLLPGGTLLVTNVSECRDSYFMSKMLEWDLIYRSAEHLSSLVPAMEGFSHTVYTESTGTNVVAEIKRN